MRNLLIAVFSILSFALQSQEKIGLLELYENQLYSQLEVENTDKSNLNYFFYKAVFAHACNNNSVSLYYLDSLEKVGVSDAIVYNYCILKFDNYVKLFAYKDAASTILEVMEKFKSVLNESQVKGLHGAYNLNQAMANVLPQEVESFGACRIPYMKDKYGLITFKVGVNGVANDFVFDTGSTYSVVTESMAKTLGFTFLAGSFAFGGVGGLSSMKLAVAPPIYIGKIMIENVVFNVVGDDALTFGNYKINGIIGLYVAKELGTFIFEKDTLTIDESMQTNKIQDKNFFTKYNFPIVLMTYKNRTLPFLFDTGSATTTFSGSFYEDYKSDIKGIHRNQKYQGMGGSSKHKVVIVKSLKMQLLKATLSFSNLVIYKRGNHPLGKRLYGSIGQDVSNNFKRMIISFNGNYLRLEN